MVGGDVKQPDNLLLTEGTKLRITDFGCAIKFKPGQDQVVRDTSGTFSFLAPECCSGQPYSPFTADVWAAGVTLYCFIVGRLPFAQEGR